MAIDMILFSSSYFDPGKVDEDLQMEYEAVLSTGLFEVGIFGYDKWFNEGKLILRTATGADVKAGETGQEKTAVYRGWMMKPEQYEKFFQSLSERNVRLITEPDSYRLMHIFPNVYDLVKEDTAKMRIYSLHTQINVNELKNEFKRFMIKDFVKSVKGTKFPRYFDQEISQEDFDRWMEVFYQYRGGLLTGGICVKEYLDLKMYGKTTNEFRVFYLNHEPATVSRNSLQADYVPAPPRELIEKYRDLNSPFYTVDYGELADGSWKILEAGDGSVSGLSEGQDTEHFFRTLYYCFS